MAERVQKVSYGSTVTALYGMIFGSTDGGVHWSLQTKTSLTGWIGPIVCSSDSRCLVVEDREEPPWPIHTPPVLYLTSDAGKTWMEEVLPKAVERLDAISCVNSLKCWAVGEQGVLRAIVLLTTNGGVTWDVVHTPQLWIGMGVPLGLSCPSTQVCVIVGEGSLTTSDGGTSWQLHSFPTGQPNDVGELNVVACTSTSHCVAEMDFNSGVPQYTGTAVATSTNGGASWQLQVKLLPGGVSDLRSLSCPTSSDCVSVGPGWKFPSAAERTLDGGRTWQLSKLSFAMAGVSCAPRTSDCVAVGGTNSVQATPVVLRSVNDGATWTVEPRP